MSVYSVFCVYYMNELIISEFNSLKKCLELDNNEVNIYKIRVINRLIRHIKSLKLDIKDSSEINIPGIGTKTKAKVDKIIRQGSLGINSSQFSDLNRVFGIGTSLMKKLTDIGIDSYKQLAELVTNNKIKVPRAVKLGIKYHNDLQKKIPRNEMHRIRARLLRVCPTGIVCGSYRRRKQYSSDIDFLIIDESLKNIVTRLKNDGLIIDDISIGQSKYMGLCKVTNLTRRIDIINVPKESKFTALMYFTGSKEFNTRIRAHAKSMGYKLNEYRLTKGDTIIKIQSERDVFNLLKLPYLPPNLRG